MDERSEEKENLAELKSYSGPEPGASCTEPRHSLLQLCAACEQELTVEPSHHGGGRAHQGVPGAGRRSPAYHLERTQV